MPRFLWPLAWLLLFRPSPRIAAFNWWRVGLLRAWGCDLYNSTRIYPSAWLAEPWSCYFGPRAVVGEGAVLIGGSGIGEDATISQEAYLDRWACIGQNAWVCARAFIGESANVGRGAVVGACSVVTETAPAWQVVAGNPARIIKERKLCESSSASP